MAAPELCHSQCAWSLHSVDQVCGKAIVFLLTGRT